MTAESLGLHAEFIEIKDLLSGKSEYDGILLAIIEYLAGDLFKRE